MTRNRNLITDVAGLTVGHSSSERLRSGTTAILFDRPATASVFVPGGAPAGRDLGCLEPERSVERVDAIVLSGGSGFGLDAPGGAQAWLRKRGRGLPVGRVRVPIVPGAILFDLLNGGDKDWGRYPPYREFAWEACAAASADFALGSVGAGLGATTVDLKGGIGSASATTTTGATVGAIVAVNAIGSAIVGRGPHFWAAPFERGSEYGSRGWPAAMPVDDGLAWKGRTILPNAEPGTTIGLVATDASLTKSESKRLAIMASGGLAKALRIAFAPSDGDTIFAASTQVRAVGQDDLTEIGIVASDVFARAIARGVFEARGFDAPGATPSWTDLFAAA